MYKIVKTIIDHISGVVHVYFDRYLGEECVGTNLYRELSENDPGSRLSVPAWTNDDLIAELAAKLDVPAENVAIADPPAPHEPPAVEPNLE